MPIVSVTQRGYFKACRRQHDYMYRQHLKPVHESINAMWIGRLFHYAMQAYYSNRNWQDAIAYWLSQKLTDEMRASSTPEEVVKQGEIVQLVHSMMTQYIEATKNDEWEVIAVEKELRKKVRGTIVVLTGHLDLLVRWKSGLWVVDHKGLASFADPEALEFDDQMTSYLWLVREMFGETPAGAIYNQVRKKIPSEPLLLKSGKSLSKDKSIDTTYAVYLAAIEKNGFNPLEYEELLERLKHNEFVKRETIARGPKELDLFEKQLVSELREMVRHDTAIYPNQTQDCVWRCGYKDLCRAETFGGDVQSVAEANYVVREGRDL